MFYFFMNHLQGLRVSDAKKKNYKNRLNLNMDFRKVPLESINYLNLFSIQEKVT